MPPTPFSDTTEDASVSDLSGLTLTGADGDALIRTSATTIAANPTLHVDAANARVGVGVTTPSTALQVSGTVTATAFAGDVAVVARRLRTRREGREGARHLIHQL